MTNHISNHFCNVNPISKIRGLKALQLNRWKYYNFSIVKSFSTPMHQELVTSQLPLLCLPVNSTIVKHFLSKPILPFDKTHVFPFSKLIHNNPHYIQCILVVNTTWHI